MPQIGKCNVCATPCASCIRIGRELWPTGSTSDCFSDGACERKVACPQISQTSAVSSQKSEEGNVESKFSENSCIRGAGPSPSVEYHRIDINENNAIVSSVMTDSSQQRAPQTFNFEPASCCLADYHSEIDDKPLIPVSYKKLRKEISEGIIPSFVKPNSKGLSSLNDFHDGPTSVKEHLGGCAMDHMESSSSIGKLGAANEDFKKDVDSAKSSKFESVETIATKSIGCSNHGEDTVSIKQSNVEKPCQLSKFVGCDDESDLSDDVKVCDICGDTGREDCLAVCSKCRDGAEHVYCMRTRLDKVPDSNWMCEECVLLEDKEKMTKTKSEKFVTCGKYKSSNQSYKGDQISMGSGLKVHPQTNCKGFVDNKSSGGKVSSQASAERSSSNLTSALMRKRIAVETKSGPSLTSTDSKASHPQNFAIKASHELCARNELSSRTRSIQENAAFTTIAGNLTRSKSFKDSYKKPRVLLLDEIPENQFSNETHNKKKGSTVRTLRKSVSFNDASSGRSNAFGPKVQRIPPKFCEDVEMKRLRYMKEHDSAEMASTFELNRPQVGPPEDGMCFSASSHDKAFASHGETMLVDIHGTKCHNPEAIQSSRESAKESKVKNLCLRMDDVVQNLQSPTSSHTSQELKHKGETIFRSSLLKVPPTPDASREDKLAAQKGSSNQTEKSPQTSNFSWSSTGSLLNRGGSDNLSHTSQTRLADSSLVSVHDGAMVKDRNESSQMDLVTPFCNHLTTLAFPQFDYIWRGELEIHSGRLPKVLYKIQAHMSTQASPRIPEAVKKFSDKILLEEVSRLNAWPAQFQEHYPQDDNIGLYFFAEDIRSYGNYKSLLERMIDYDLALRGNFDAIELLIFPSNLLPEGSQHWNGLLFLWGVFKNRKISNGL